MVKKVATNEDIVKLISEIKTDISDLHKAVDGLAIMSINRFDKNETLFNLLTMRVRGIGEDIEDVKNTIKTATRFAGAHEKEISELSTRITRLEKQKVK